MSSKPTTVERCLDVLIDAREKSDHAAEKDALCNLGNIYREMGEIQYALQSYEQALTICRETGDDAAEGSVLWNMSLAIGRLDGQVRAIDLAEAALNIYEKISDPRSDLVRDQLKTWMDKRKGAVASLDQALDEARDKDDLQAEESILSDLGDAYTDLGEIKLAIECYEQALAIGRRIANSPREGDDLWNISLSVYKMGGHARAIELAGAALKIYENTGDPKAEKLRQTLEMWKKEIR